MCSIAGHGKGEVDHVVGLAKVAIGQAVASGHLFLNSFEMVDYLQDKLKTKENSTCVFRVILSKLLDEERSEMKTKVVGTKAGPCCGECIDNACNLQRVNSEDRTSK